MPNNIWILIMTILSSIALIGATFVLAATPGPGVFVTISRAIASGFANATVLVFGLILGDIIFLLLAIYGLNFIAQVLGELFTVVKYIGGAYLIYLGYKIWTSKSTKFHLKKTNKISWRENYLSGLFISLSNPKVILFYLGFLPAFIDLQTLTTADVFLVTLIVALTLASVLLSYAYMTHRARELFTNQKALNRLNKTSGGVMMGAGALLILKN